MMTNRRNDPDYADHVRDYEPQERFKIQCKYCNEVGFEWKQENGSWMLYDYLGERHSCRKGKDGTFFKMA